MVIGAAVQFEQLDNKYKHKNVTWRLVVVRNLGRCEVQQM